MKMRGSVRGFGSLYGCVLYGCVGLMLAALACGDDAPSEQPAAPARPTPNEMGAPDAAPDPVDIAGTWLGTLALPPAPIRFVLNITRGPGGGWTGTADSPDQGGFGIPITRIDVAGDQVVVRLDELALEYSGELSSDGQTLTGTLRQAGTPFPLTLERQAGPLDYRRPQDPVAPFPYTTAEVTFPSEDAGVTLAGTLISPEGAGPFTTVVLLTGSGPQNRDEELLNHRPFLVLADALARANLAVLRFDDRGVGGSTGDFDAATSLDFAADVRGAVGYLRSQSLVPVGSIGLVGHSEGGLIAPIVADGNADVDFLVLLAGPAVDGETIVISQGRAINAAAGVPPSQLDAEEAVQRTVYACFRNPEGGDAGADAGAVSEAALDACLRRELAAAGVSDSDMAASLAPLQTAWSRFFITYDPAPALRRTRIPVLALNGSLDLQVLASVNLPVMRAALAEAGNPLSSVSELPGLNHLFQHATTGLPAEYGLITETMAPEVLAQVAQWIVSLPATGP